MVGCPNCNYAGAPPIPRAIALMAENVAGMTPNNPGGQDARRRIFEQ